MGRICITMWNFSSTLTPIIVSAFFLFDFVYYRYLYLCVCYMLYILSALFMHIPVLTHPDTNNQVTIRCRIFNIRSGMNINIEYWLLIIIIVRMYLRYYLDEKGNRIYTLKVVLDDGSYTLNAHPARFSPDDKFSKERIECKSRFGLLLTQV